MEKNSYEEAWLNNHPLDMCTCEAFLFEALHELTLALSHLIFVKQIAFVLFQFKYQLNPIILL